MAKDCTTADIYQSLNWCDGQTVLPGIRPKVFFQKKSNIAAWPKLPKLEEAKSMGELATYKGNFTMAAEKKWLTINSLSAKSNVTTEVQGERPSTTSLNNLVFLVQQRNGKFRVMGCEEFETVTKPAQALGEGVTGEAGTTLEIEATDVCPAPFYPGKIETEDGDISGADGSAWSDSSLDEP